MRNLDRAKNYQKKLYAALNREWDESHFRDYWEGTFFGLEWDYLYDNELLENEFCAWCGSEELNNGYFRAPHFSERRVKIFICDECFMRVTGGNVPYKMLDGSSRSKCFIATAVYGDPNHPSVTMLKTHRDNVLNKSKLGRLFIKLYYIFSPHISVFIKQHPKLQILLKENFFRPIIMHISKKNT